MLTMPRTISLRAGSLDATLARWAAEASRDGRIHSVFRRVINIEIADGGLVALAHASLDDAPWTIRVDRFGEFADLVRVGDPVVFAAGGLQLAGDGVVFDIELGAAQEWDTSPPELGSIDAGGLARAAARLDRLVREHGRAGGMLGARPGSAAAEASPFETVASAMLEERSARLIAALRDGDRAGTADALTSIIGLGPGLTPAGDDFATGLAWVASGSTTALAGFTAILADELARRPEATTPLSRVTMREAVRGRIRGQLEDAAAAALRTADDEERTALAELSAPVLRVVRIGHTSGTDVLSGLAAGLRLEGELRGVVAGNADGRPRA